MITLSISSIFLCIFVISFETASKRPSQRKTWFEAGGRQPFCSCLSGEQDLRMRKSSGVIARLPNLTDLVGGFLDRSNSQEQAINRFMFQIMVLHVLNNNQNSKRRGSLQMNDISIFTVLSTSPAVILDHPSNSETFFQMLKNMLAPYYKIKSLTTILMALGIIIYITLVCRQTPFIIAGISLLTGRYPPFLRVPGFAMQGLVLMPEHLRHFQFYRIMTAPFVYQDITSLLLGSLVIWSLGSFTEQMLGWKLFISLSSLSGLIGFSNSLSLPTFLLGCNFAIAIMRWPDPNSPILYRKIMLVIYVVIGIVYVLLFFNYDINEKWNIYASTLAGITLTFIVGKQREGRLTMYRKSLKTVGAIGFVTVNTYLLIDLIFNKRTWV